MVSRAQGKLALRRKLNVLRLLTSSKSSRKKSVIMDALHYINELKLKLEMLSSSYKKLVSQLQVSTVKVEKIEKRFVVRVSCPKGRDLLVKILEAFEEMGLNVLQARVSCNNGYFRMEAIAEEEEESEGEKLDAQIIEKTLLKGLECKM